MNVELGFKVVKNTCLFACLSSGLCATQVALAGPGASIGEASVSSVSASGASLVVAALDENVSVENASEETASSTSPTKFMYHINLSVEEPNQAFIEVDTSLTETSFWFPARRLDDAEPIELTCHNGQQTNSLPYGIKQSCDKVSWPIRFATVPELGVDPSVQINHYFPATKARKQPWYLLTEWRSLPRLKTEVPIEVCFDEKHCQVMPELSQAPMFMIYNMPSHELPLYNQPLNLFTDVPALLESQELWQPIMEEQMGYLMGVFSAYRTKPWDLVAFGREVSAGNLGGAAGNRVFMTNVPLEDGKIQPGALKHFFKITAHESLHFISAVDSPVWLSESLAEYYAQKSLVDTEYAFPDPVQVWRERSVNMPVADTGLYLASEKVSQQQLMQYYPLFYLKGTAFWLDLDLHLQRNQSSLDNYVSLLQTKKDEPTNHSRSSSKTDDVTLPLAFVEAVSKVIGKSVFSQLETRYLLSPIQ